MNHWIVIPAFNEADAIAEVVRRARPHGPVLVVDDGSTDGSGAAAEAAGAEVLRLPRRRGKGAAILRGAAHALSRGACLILTLDADGQHDPGDIPRLLAAARRTPRALVIGGRFGEPGRIPLERLNAARVAGFFINWLTGSSVEDTQSGFRAYPAEIFAAGRLRRGGFVLEAESLLAAGRTWMELREIPIAAIYLPGRRSRFRPVRDGCAVGGFLAARVMARLAADAGRMLLRGAAPFTLTAMRRRHAALARETAAYRATPAHFGIAAGAFVVRRAAAVLPAWWKEPRTAEFRAAAAAVLASPLLGVLGLQHALGVPGSADRLTRFILRFYALERLNRARHASAPRDRVPVPAPPRAPEEPPRPLLEQRAP